MPECKYCGQSFNRERDTKLFCGSTCRSLARYHKNDSVQEKDATVQDEYFSVQVETELPTTMKFQEYKELPQEEVTYDDSADKTPAEFFNPEF